MPASLPLQLAKFPRKHTAPALTFFVGWGLKRVSTVLNLFRNALDALPPDGGLVDVVLSVSDSRPYLTVTDNGCGIPNNMMDNLFTPFFTSKPQGSGVGLAICHQIITLHGGEIRVQSQPAKGTKVIISL